ncbi:MAG: DUF2934 domain-containing protein [Pseudomonadota bacterium]
MARPKKALSIVENSAAAEAEIHKTVTPEERERMIAEAAYYRAERRAFQGGDPDLDWLEAEAEIDRKLGIESVEEE